MNLETEDNLPKCPDEEIKLPELGCTGIRKKIREKWKEIVTSVKSMEILNEDINKHKRSLFLFATIGLIATVHLIVTLLINASGYRTSSLVNHAHFDKTTKECLDNEDCPWNLVFSELGDKLLLLEMAFKEQASAREGIENAVNNHTTTHMFTTGRLSELISRIENLTVNYEQMDKRVSSLSRRLFSDEIIGFILFVIVMVEVVRQIRPHVRPLIDLIKSKIATMRAKKAHMNGAVMNGMTENEIDRLKDETDTMIRKEEKKQTNSPNISMIPKLGILKNEVCIVLFKYENIPVYTNVVEAMLNQFYDVKVAAVSHPYFMIESQKDINSIPHVKLFIVICNSHGNHTNGGRDLLAVSLKIMKRLGATIIVIIGNDEGSVKLPSHNLYNTNLHLINSIDMMQELAYNNLVFSVQHEMTSFHQTSHFRKTIKTVLNARLNAQCRHLLKAD
ncbi:uncharacterized protein LOC134686804 isoform X2 [Mytilus trossulus]|uniref:uncharacterized protein LOC134686804 isoform X2 n=1 Tax=Mytilus trossulus TaxID=6551 RepID=UPI003007BD6E